LGVAKGIDLKRAMTPRIKEIKNTFFMKDKKTLKTINKKRCFNKITQTKGNCVASSNRDFDQL